MRDHCLFQQIHKGFCGAQRQSAYQRKSNEEALSFRETSTLDSQITCAKYHIPRRNNGDEMSLKNIDEFRGMEFFSVF